MDSLDPVVDLAVDNSPLSHRSRWLGIGAGVVALVVVVGGFAAWRFASGFGAPTDSASAIPAEAQFYMNFDLALVRDGSRLQSIVDTFPSAFEDEFDGRDVIAEYDRLLMEETGMTVSDDVIPWIGRSAGFAVWDVDPETLGAAPSIIFAVKVRDREAADLFVERLATSQGAAVVSVIDGVSIWGIEEGPDTGFLARAGDMMLASPNQGSMQTAIDTIAGDRPSLLDDAEFQDTLSVLPRGAGDLTWYVPSRVWSDITTGIDTIAGGFFGDGGEQSLFRDEDPFAGLGAGAFTLSLNDEGIRADAALFTDDAVAYQTPTEITSRIPGDALFFVAVDSETTIDQYARAIEDAAIATDLDAFRAETGIDPVSDIVETLAGSFGVYGRPGDSVTTGEFDLGIGSWIGLTNPQRMAETILKIEDYARSIDSTLAITSGELSTVDIGDGNPPLRYGVVDDWLTFGWNTDSIRDSEGPSIVDSNGYRSLSSALDGDLVAYVDIAALVERFATSDQELRTELAALRRLGVTVGSADGVVSGSVLLEVDWAG